MLHTVVKLLLLLAAALLPAACHYPADEDHWVSGDAGEIDSVEFRAGHHYWRGYNFVATDSFRILSRPPFNPELVFVADSSMLIGRHDLLAVEDVEADTAGATGIWVKVAAVTGLDSYEAEERVASGWIREADLLGNVVPDAPVSKFIHGFSDGRLKFVLACFGLAFLLYMVQAVRRHRLRLVHFDDIGCPYSTLLCMAVAGTAVLYQSLQVYVPETWEEYYFHPTLNPFHPDLPPVMSLFVAAVWGLILLGVATLDDLRRRTDLTDGFSYAAGVGGVCMVLYLFFTIAIPVRLGYLLLPAYWYFALHRYRKSRSPRYFCGHCGHPLSSLGHCPRCGSLNR